MRFRPTNDREGKGAKRKIFPVWKKLIGFLDWAFLDLAPSPLEIGRNPRLAILVAQGDCDRPTKGKEMEVKERKYFVGLAETPWLTRLTAPGFRSAPIRTREET